MMQIRSFNAPSAPQGFHAQVCAVEGATRLAFVSGQVPATAAGAVPESLAEQSRLIWRNIEAQLAEVGMSLDNVVKATTFLSDRKYAIENREKMIGRPFNDEIVAALGIAFQGVTDFHTKVPKLA